MDDDKLPFEPPEPGYVTEEYVLKIPVTDKHLKNPWELRKHAAKLIEKELGDSVQMTDLKVHMPGPLIRTFSRLFRKIPQAKLHATIKF